MQRRRVFIPGLRLDDVENRRRRLEALDLRERGCSFRCSTVWVSEADAAVYSLTHVTSLAVGAVMNTRLAAPTVVRTAGAPPWPCVPIRRLWRTENTTRPNNSSTRRAKQRSEERRVGKERRD